MPQFGLQSPWGILTAKPPIINKNIGARGKSDGKCRPVNKTLNLVKIDKLCKTKGKGKEGMELNLCYFNCRGMASEERVYEFERAIEKIKWDIIGLSAVRKKGKLFLLHGRNKRV